MTSAKGPNLRTLQEHSVESPDLFAVACSNWTLGWHFVHHIFVNGGTGLWSVGVLTPRMSGNHCQIGYGPFFYDHIWCSSQVYEWHSCQL